MYPYFRVNKWLVTTSDVTVQMTNFLGSSLRTYSLQNPQIQSFAAGHTHCQFAPRIMRGDDSRAKASPSTNMSLADTESYKGL